MCHYCPSSKLGMGHEKQTTQEQFSVFNMQIFVSHAIQKTIKTSSSMHDATAFHCVAVPIYRALLTRQYTMYK
jgi:hypothetical protein